MTAEINGFLFGGDGTLPVSTGSSFFAGCSWDPLPAGEELTVRPDITSVNFGDSVFDVDYWVVYCGPGGLSAYAFYEQGATPPAPMVVDMIVDAYQRTPVLGFNPQTSPDGTEDIFIVVHTDTFLWVDEDGWDTTVTATASAPELTVTTEATPRLARWSYGDKTVECGGDDMHSYVFGIGGADAQPSNCSLVFTKSSALQTNEIILEVEWSASWSCSNLAYCGSGGPLPDIVVTSIREVVVGEILAVSS